MDYWSFLSIKAFDVKMSNVEIVHHNELVVFWSENVKKMTKK